MTQSLSEPGRESSSPPGWFVDLVAVSKVFSAPLAETLPETKMIILPKIVKRALSKPKPKRKPSNQRQKTSQKPAKNPILPNLVRSIAVKAPPIEEAAWGLKGGFPYDWYLDVIKSRLWEHWESSARFNDSQICGVKFVIQRNGEVKNASVLSPSKDPLYDQMALSAIADASPFPSLPKGFLKDQIEVTVEFQFTGE